MVLIVRIGKTFIDDFYANLSVSPPLTELAVMVVVVVILLALVAKVPPALAAIVGGPRGAGNIGGFGAASALMAAGATLGVAAAGAAAGAAALVGAGASTIGGASAVRAAVQKANQNMADGTGWFRDSTTGPSPENSHSLLFPNHSNAAVISIVAEVDILNSVHSAPLSS